MWYLIALLVNENIIKPLEWLLVGR